MDFSSLGTWPEEKPKVAPDLGKAWFTPAHKIMLSKFLSEETKLVLELGSFAGRSTIAMAELAPKATILCVDHFLGSKEHLERPSMTDWLPELYERFLVNCWSLRDRIVPIRMTTLVGMAKIYVLGVRPDLIYVDAAHDTSSVISDTKAALELFPDAQIVGDDIGWATVKHGVEHLITDHKLKVVMQSPGWWVEK